MQDATVVPSLVPGWTAFLFKDDDFDAWVATGDLVCSRKTYDSRSDNNDFHVRDSVAESVMGECWRSDRA